MAYVGTPRFLGNARDTLASIIQGEAGGEGVRGMQAVAQVISNRASQNFSGYGSDLVSQALAPHQFQGQSGTPSAAAYQVADQALSGSLPNVVGSGAVNYANPGASTASWARNLSSDNSFQLGNHFFTDNTRGRPYSPDLTTSTGNNAAAGDGLGYANYSGGSGNVETSVGTQVQSYDDGGGTGQASVVFGNGDSGDGLLANGNFGSPIDSSSFAGSLNVGGALGAGNASVTDGLPSALSGSAPSLDGATLDPGVTAGSVAGSGDNIAGYNAAGPVQANPALVGAVNQQGQNATKAIQEGDKNITKGVETAGKTIGQAITTQSQSWVSWASDSLLRVFVLVIGLALFAGALYYFGKPAIDGAVKKLPKVVPV
jgi:hypothetical protein